MRSIISSLVGPQEPLLAAVKRRKLAWFGHVRRHDSLPRDHPSVTLTLKIANNFFSACYSGSVCCITIPSLVTKYFVVQKISSGKIFTDIFNLCCDLDLERSSPFFSAWLSGLWCCTMWMRRAIDTYISCKPTTRMEQIIFLKNCELWKCLR